MDRKYYQYRPYLGDIDGAGQVQYEWGHKGFFKTTHDSFYSLLIYEENGKFYEFLTGTFLGICKNQYGTPYIFSDEFEHKLPLNVTSLGCVAITAESFAYLAKKYLQDKNKIIPYLNKRFDEWRKCAEAKRKAEVQETIKKREKSEDVNWLDNLLDNR